EEDLSKLFQIFMGVLTFAGLPANLIGGWLARKVALGKLLGFAMAAFARIPARLAPSSRPARWPCVAGWIVVHHPARGPALASGSA
ncbi:MAG TPA: hypothetical protein VM533_00205, partial [Fimbriiglobus sp.]|nr:hypothetical protein [Fimbriiglobus sp.]